MLISILLIFFFSQVSALDQDLGINAQLEYYIQKGNSEGLFFISPSGTFQILHHLDREVQSLYFVTIIAVDSGDSDQREIVSLFCRCSAVVVPSNSLIIQFFSFEGLPPLTGTLTINIIVDDVNDNHPEFTEDAYTTMVYEDSPAGTVFAMITASDVDEGVNGELRYNVC